MPPFDLEWWSTGGKMRRAVAVAKDMAAGKAKPTAGLVARRNVFQDHYEVHAISPVLSTPRRSGRAGKAKPR